MQRHSSTVEDPSNIISNSPVSSPNGKRRGSDIKMFCLRLSVREIEAIRAESDRAKVNEVDVFRKAIRLLFSIKPSERCYERTNAFRARRALISCLYWGLVSLPLGLVPWVHLSHLADFIHF